MLPTTRSMLRALSFTVIVGSLYLAFSYHDSSSVSPPTATASVTDSIPASAAGLPTLLSSNAAPPAEDEARTLLGSRLDSWFRRVPFQTVAADTAASPSAIASKQISIQQGHLAKDDANLMQDDKGAGLISGNTTSRETCLSLYGKRTYFSPTEQRLPPILYTFPGSGNTWARLLIEYSTNVFTGSVYNDKTLLQALPGEFKCNWKVSAIKVHPHTHNFEDLRTGRFASDADKCRRGGIKGFDRAVLLIRDPFDSIWSEFQRRTTQSHVTGIRRDEFGWHQWQANAANLANLYYTMWHVQHAGIEKHFRGEDILYVKYEDLKSPKARVAALARVRNFVLRGQTPLDPAAPATQQRVQCAFALAENRGAHRAIDPTRRGDYMTKEEAYTVPLVCRMWALFGRYAALHAYRPWRDTNCTGDTHPPIPMVNVGPQGEYNSRWVKRGQKQIDFGGYNSTGFPSPDELEDLLRARKGWKKKVRNKGNSQPPSGTRFAKNSQGLASISATPGPPKGSSADEAPPSTPRTTVPPRREKDKGAAGDRGERVRAQKAAARSREKERLKKQGGEGKKGKEKEKEKGKGKEKGKEKEKENDKEMERAGTDEGTRGVVTYSKVTVWKEGAAGGGMSLEEAMTTTVGREPVGQKKAAWQ